MSSHCLLSTQFSVSRINDDVLVDGYPRDSLSFARQLATVKSIQGNDEPFMVMNIGRVDELLNQWFKQLPRVQPYYPIQCNSNDVLLKTLAASPLIGGFHCNTRSGLDNALEYMPSDRVLYSNPCWTRSALDHARSNCIQSLAFESSLELDRILLHHPNAELLLQLCLNPESEDPNARMGCEPAKAAHLLQYAVDMGANCVGMAFNMGSGRVRPALYGSAIECARQLFDVGKQMGLSFNVLSIVGGFSSQDDSLFGEVCGQINHSLNDLFPRESFPALRVIATPGSFFSESVFSLVTNIIGRRSVDASVITNDDFDSGNEAFIYQTNQGYYGAFGCRITTNQEPESTPLFENEMEDGFPSEHAFGSIVGPTLDEFDVVQSLCQHRRLSVGDWLIWRNMGAYSLNNVGSLEEGEEDARSSLAIFYFNNTRQQHEWTYHLADSRKVSSVKPAINCADDDGMGSCDEVLSVMDSSSIANLESRQTILDDEEDDDDDEAEKNLWILGWLLHDQI